MVAPPGPAGDGGRLTISLATPDRLETGRASLRPWRSGDDAALHGALVESVDHLSPWIPWATRSAPSRDRARWLVDDWIEQRQRGDNVIYAAFEGGTRLVGGVGLYARVGHGALEVGYWLRSSAAGRGLATEIVGRLVEAAFELPAVDRLEIHTDPGNRPSRRVAEKLGFRPVGGRGPRGGMVYLLNRPPREPRNAPTSPGVG